MSALALISSALPPGADLPGGVAEGPFLTPFGHWPWIFSVETCHLSLQSDV